jgi:hypothetical protein
MHPLPARPHPLEVPLQFSAFHPDFRMLDVPPTPPETLSRARRIAAGDTPLPGVFESKPGTWGPRRQPVDMRMYG